MKLNVKTIKFWLILTCFLLLVTYIVGGYVYYRFYRQYQLIAPAERFQVDSGETFAAVADRLARAGVIGSKNIFRWMARLKQQDRKLKTGEYEFSGKLTPAMVLADLVKGNVIQHRLTIPEGFDLAQIAQAVEKAGLGRAGVFLKTARDKSFLEREQIPGDSAEGYLFPDTYFFAGNAGEKAILRQMHQRMMAVLTPQWRQQAAETGVDLHQVLTLASIVEKETGALAERAQIAAVFHNRLKKGMRLQSDPTVIYGIKDFDGNLTKHHLKTKTAYNTYQIKGLPPGPIASPGRDAIQAVLFPARHALLYFVAKGDGTHHFSKTLAEHNRAVRRYQLKKK